MIWYDDANVVDTAPSFPNSKPTFQIGRVQENSALIKFDFSLLI